MKLCAVSSGKIGDGGAWLYEAELQPGRGPEMSLQTLEAPEPMKANFTGQDCRWAAKKRKGLKSSHVLLCGFFKKIFICLFGCTGS